MLHVNGIFQRGPFPHAPEAVLCPYKYRPPVAHRPDVANPNGLIGAGDGPGFNVRVEVVVAEFQMVQRG